MFIPKSFWTTKTIHLNKNLAKDELPSVKIGISDIKKALEKCVYQLILVTHKKFLFFLRVKRFYEILFNDERLNKKILKKYMSLQFKQGNNNELLFIIP